MIIELHKLSLGVRMKMHNGGFQIFTTKAKNVNNVSLREKTTRDFCSLFNLLTF